MIDRSTLIAAILVATILSAGCIVSALSRPPIATVSVERIAATPEETSEPLPLFPGRD
jgi:hypothetical protein